MPRYDVHAAFIGWAGAQIQDARTRQLFERMAGRSGIAHRWSVLPPTESGGSPVQPGGFYAGNWPTTGQRMTLYAQAAPVLAEEAVRALERQTALGEVTHMVLASCTGFAAPGVDQMLAQRLCLSSSVERLLVGYMGCYAAVAALRSARHIVRSEPTARVLVVCVELSSLHLQQSQDVEALLAMLQFGDGAAAALVSNKSEGLEIGQPFAATLPESHDLIRWDVGDHGFAMHLSGQVPGAIAQALSDPAMLPLPARDVDCWAVHAGGRSILDAVAHSLSLPSDALQDSRRVLHDNGNMSSATLMFVLEHILTRPGPAQGMALAFGPGLAAEGFTFSGATS